MMKLNSTPLKTPHKIIFVVGSTASGKTDLALKLATQYSGVIVNCDSVQFYKELLIGSASPNEFEKKQVPHFLYNYVSAPQEMTAGQFLRDFYSWLGLFKGTGPIFVVGGTGFYIQALEKGMYDVPEVSEEVRQQVLLDFEALGAEKMYQELHEFDPKTNVHPNDHYRIGRALEIQRQFGQKMTAFSEGQRENKNKLQNPFMKVGQWLEKEILSERVRQRSLKMIQSGLIEEVENILKNTEPTWAPLNSVGYLETVQYLQGKIPRERLVEDIQTSTMRLIKKQKTWFKRDDAVLWSRDLNWNDEWTLKIDQFLSE